jgi:hypothetical protein
MHVEPLKGYSHKAHNEILNIFYLIFYCFDKNFNLVSHKHNKNRGPNSKDVLSFPEKELPTLKMNKRPLQ